jgi:subtilisin family serine protease
VCPIRNRRCARPGAALAALLILLLVSSPAPASEPPAVVPGEILIRFRSGAAPLNTLFVPPQHPGRGGLSPLSTARPRARSEASNRLARTARLALPPGSDPAEAALAWSARSDVEYAGPVHLIPLLGAFDSGASPLALPNDPGIVDQWHHVSIGSAAAWETVTGDSATIIAIIDTGVDYNHPDLAPNLWRNEVEANGQSGVDDDANGYVDDAIGYDFTDVPEIDGAGDYAVRDPDPMDDVGHGTWVAGVAAAAGNNGIGGAGVAYGARYMPLRAGFRPRIGFSLGFLAEDDAAAAVVYAVDNGADVLNLSFGDLVRAPILEDAVRYAVERGVIVVAASGNSGTSLPFYPAALHGVVAVGAVDRDGRRASFSSWGPGVSLLAPGQAVVTTDLESGMTAKSGTSLAAPVVAGAAALLRSLHPDWTAEQIAAVLLRSAADPAGAADARGARLIQSGAAVGAPSRVTIDLEGLDQGDSFHERVPFRGTIQGAAVRGWQVLVRRSLSGEWTRLAGNPRGVPIDTLFAEWDVAAEPEGNAWVRVEALDFSGVAHSRDIAIAVDHTPPAITDLAVTPIVNGPHYGLRVTAVSDEDVLGRLVVTIPAVRFEYRSVITARNIILGLDGPLGPPGTTLTAEATFTNGAGLSRRHTFTIDLPFPADLTEIRKSSAPGVRTWLPVLVDLDGDGRNDAVGELPAPPGQVYGNVAAFSRCDAECGAPEGGIELEEVWRSTAEYIPRDAADFDGDGVPEILGLSFGGIRIYTRGPGSEFPDSLGWSSGEAWASRFIPAPGGAALDVVATHEDELRIYRRDGATLALRQVVSNPTTGINSITPDVALVSTGAGHEPSLATLDGDNDLIVVSRDDAGDFQPRWSRRLTGTIVGGVTAVDFDADGVDELAVVEAVGELPSPAAELRDGFYRLQVFRRSGDSDYEMTVGYPLGAAGYFPGNPVSLDAADMNADGHEELWWGINDRLYQVVESGNDLYVLGSWDGVHSGPPAHGVLNHAGAGRRVLLFPGDPDDSDPDALTDSATLLSAEGVSGPFAIDLALHVRDARAGGDGFEVTIGWIPVRPPFTVVRRRAGHPEEAGLVVSGLLRSFHRDTTLVPGERYVYHVSSAAGQDFDSLLVAARLGNRIVSAGFEAGSVSIEWEHPIQATERARVELDSLDVSSAGLDRSGRRLLVRTVEPPAAGVSLAFRVTGYRSDPAWSLGSIDSAAEVTAPVPTGALALRSARHLDRTRLRLEFAGAVPINPTPDDFHLEPGLDVVQVVPADGAIELVLDDATPLRAGAYSIRLDPGLTGSGGAAVTPGQGDVLAFSVLPLVFPNPVRAGHHAVRFDWLAEGARVTVVDLHGREVWSGSAQGGVASWNLVSTTGNTVAPGIYLYRVDGDFGVSGKLALVR